MELDDLVDVSNKIAALQNKYNSLHQVTDGLKCNLKNKQDKNWPSGLVSQTRPQTSMTFTGGSLGLLDSGILQEASLTEEYGEGTSGWLDMQLNLVDILNNPTSTLSVISFGDWGWALGLWQLGVQSVQCLLATSVTASLLKKLIAVVPGMMVTSVLHPQSGIIVAHLSWVKDLLNLDRLLPTEIQKILISCSAMIQREVFQTLAHLDIGKDQSWFRTALQHRDLGGLTQLKVSFLWCDGSHSVGDRMMVDNVELPDIIPQRWDPVQFLEPSVQLTQWIDPSSLEVTMDAFGDPAGVLLSNKAKSRAWDLGQGYLLTPLCSWSWVIAETVFLGG